MKIKRSKDAILIVKGIRVTKFPTSIMKKEILTVRNLHEKLEG